MPDRQTLAEAGTVTLTETTAAGTAHVTLITPGQGSSGQYSPAVLEAAATEGVFPAGTHMYLDHPGPDERPERSLDRLAGVLTEAATWDGSALVATARIYPRFRPMLAEMQDDIGVSIRAAGVIENGVVQSIGPVSSVDFVTKPGRGGAFALVESAVLVEGHGMTANDLSQIVSDAVRDTYGAKDTYTWVRDYTDDWAVFSIETPDSTALYQQAYTVTNGVAELTGDRTEVTQKTVFVPVTEADNATPIADAALEAVAPQTPAASAGQPASNPLPVPTEESQEDPMPELTEAEQAAITRAETAERERDEARAELAATRRRDTARPLVSAALAEAAIPARVRTRLTESLVADAPALADGNLDEAALTAAIATARIEAETEAAETLAEAGATGQVHGLGTGATAPAVEESLGDAELDAVYAAIYPKGA